MDNLNPKFITCFTVEYHFEERQKFKVEVYDIDDFEKNAPLTKQDFVGDLEFMLHEVVTQKDQLLKKPLQNNKNPSSKQNGLILITGEEKLEHNNEVVEMEIEASLEHHDGPNFFVVQKLLGPSHYIPVYKSEL
jgi:hypothetical protein